MSWFESIFQKVFWVLSWFQSILWEALESRVDLNRNSIKPLESWVNLNQIPDNLLCRELTWINSWKLLWVMSWVEIKTFWDCVDSNRKKWVVPMSDWLIYWLGIDTSLAYLWLITAKHEQMLHRFRLSVWCSRQLMIRRLPLDLLRCAMSRELFEAAGSDCIAAQEN